MTISKGALSAYVPASRSAPAADGFADPLKNYILETVALEDRKVRVRQLGIVLLLVGGLFVSQWPVAFSSANAVTSVIIDAEFVVNHLPATISLERMAFAGGLQAGF